MLSFLPSHGVNRETREPQAVSETEALFSVLRQSADADCVAAIERSVLDAPDRDLCRVNVLDFAAKHHLDESGPSAAFLHAARLGLFELSWNVICPGCGGVLDAGATLQDGRPRGIRVRAVRRRLQADPRRDG